MKNFNKISLTAIMAFMLGYTVYASSDSKSANLIADNIKALEQVSMLSDCTKDSGTRLTSWQKCDDGSTVNTYTRDYVCWGGGQNCNSRTVITVYTCSGSRRESTINNLAFCD